MSHHEISILGRTFKAQAGRYDRFWRRVRKGNWEQATYAAFERHEGLETLYIDFGAWIGPTVLFAAQSAQVSVALEPDPAAFAELEANLAANAGAPWQDRIVPLNLGIHKSGRPLTLYTNSAEGGDSMSSVLARGKDHSVTIETRRLEDVVRDYRGSTQNTFVKVDMEGGEYDLLPSIAPLLAEDHSTFFIEFHHRMFRQSFNDGSQDWQEAYQDAFDAAFSALPVGRRFSTDVGGELTSDEVQALLRGALARDGVQMRNLLIHS